MAISRLVVGDVVQSIIRAQSPGGIQLNVLHYLVKVSSGVSTYFDQLDALGAELLGGPDAGIATWMKSNLSEDVHIDWIQSQKVGPTRSLYTRFPVGLDCEVAEPCNAPNVSAVITKQVEVPGRGNSGSFHVGGLPPSAYEFGQLTNAFTVSMIELAEMIAAKLTLDAGALELVPVCFSQPTGIGGQTNEVVNTFVQPQLRVMRRRTLGLGQ